MKNGFLLLLILFFFSCSKNTGPGTVPAQTITDVPYGTDQKQKLDIYLPGQRNSTDTKLIVIIHGGGWTEGDKADFNPFISELQRRLPDYAIANINYRLALNNQNLFPIQENDVKAAIEFLFTKSADYKISTRMALIGASAGAHLSLLHAYKYSTPAPVKAVISLFGPTELLSLYNNPPNPAIPILLTTVTGGTPVTKLSLYEQSSPYNFVTNSSCPTLLFHGGMDPLIPASQSTLLKDKLIKNEVPNEYVFYPSEGHGWVGLSLLDTFNKMEAFLKKYMQ